MVLVIMAAGMGSRYGGLKQIDPMGQNGEFILDYSIYDAKLSGFDKVVFVILKENLDVFRQSVGKRIEKHMDVSYAFQMIKDIPAGYSFAARSKPWGTAHAVYSAREEVNDNFSVINADDFYGRRSFQLLHDYMAAMPQTEKKYAMAGYVLKNTLSENGQVARGVCQTDKNDDLQSIVERLHIERNEGVIQYYEENIWTDLPDDTVVSMNCWGFTPMFFEDIENGFASFFEKNAGNLEKAEYFLPDAVQGEMKAGNANVRVLRTPEKWYGVTYAEDKETVQRQIRKMTRDGLYPESLWDE